jgi:predicted secreted protein with PEFG-CTERM motif
MSTRFKGFALLAILLCAIGVMPVFASPALLQYPTGNVNSTNATSGNTTGIIASPSSTGISIATDKTTYNDGDKVAISGSTQDYMSDTPITLIITSPIGNIVKIDQVNVGSDRTFSDSIMATGTLWQAAGTYTVKVQYGGPDRTAETTFQFAGSAGQSSSGNTIQVDGTSLSVQYSITNGKVLGIKADTQSKSLIVSIQSTGDGVFTVTLPRGLIDAQANGQDAHYYVLTDGQEAEFQETSTTTTDRTLTIPFTNGTQEIEIIGTQIIPEFGPIAALVLAIAIISIIAVSAKTGLRFMPKY